MVAYPFRQRKREQLWWWRLSNRDSMENNLGIFETRRCRLKKKIVLKAIFQKH